MEKPLEISQGYSIRSMRRNEIAFAVDAYGEMLKEISKYDEVDLVFSQKNLETARNILEYQYANGNQCYVAVDEDGMIIAYALIMENKHFDTKGRVFCGLGLYVEPEYRKLGIATALIQHIFDELEKLGVRKFHCNFISERPSSSKVIEHFNLITNPFQVCKLFTNS